MERFFKDEEAKIKLFIISILVAVWYNISLSYADEFV